jgi:hypothetical protein
MTLLKNAVLTVLEILPRKRPVSTLQWLLLMIGADSLIASAN